jgi:hypothetical protein
MSRVEQAKRNNAIDEFELAFARLDWVRAATCLHLPSQREALEWHVACCEAALSAVDRADDIRALDEPSSPS